jgi:hypothetical protein
VTTGERYQLTGASASLLSRYRHYVGKQVTVTGPTYRAYDDQDQSREITGMVLGLAWRETGQHTGTIFDMVIQAERGVLRTIALSRITGITVQAAAAPEGQST